MHDIAAFLIKNKLKTKLFFYKKKSPGIANTSSLPQGHFTLMTSSPSC